jgi:hypothetical protein
MPTEPAISAMQNAMKMALRRPMSDPRTASLAIRPSSPYHCPQALLSAQAL